ncbi:MAG TPA: asparaginase [Gaiellaceae bacterium]|nr:asparaginase [Gaiellaceae bacterium]
MEPLRVVVRRGAVVESTHRVHAVAVRGGRVVESAGDPELVCFFRSSAKPFQALPLARAYADLDSRELAIAAASHQALPEQLDAVRQLLARAGATEEDLECGPEPTKLEHNCSGKHAGMLALCRARGWPSAGYRLAGHPVQEGCRTELAAAAEVGELATGVDGCGVVTFALTLERMAHAFSRLESLDAGASVAAAMRAHPELIRGPGAPDTVLMQRLPGWTAKGGAEALLCAVSPDGLGVVVKVEDGGSRAVGPGLAAFLARLGNELPELRSTPVCNSRGELVGAVVAE